MQEPKSNFAEAAGINRNLDRITTNASELNLEDPRMVLSFLEADQVVAAKRQTHFGPRKLSTGVRAWLWALRVYVILMMVIVLVSVFRALQAAH
ncbi:MAG: hypothetical protein ACRD5M_10380 [Candidatus Acidiferrales bacterium]